MWVSGAGLEIANLLCIPEADRPWPVLGVDLVGLGRDTASGVADLTPMVEPAEAERQLLPLARRREAGAVLPSAGALPAWCRGFSRHALFVRVGADQAGTLCEQLPDYVGALVEIARGEPIRPERSDLTRERQRAYLAAHLEEDKGLLLLEKVFDPGWARQFLRTVMFPMEAR